MKRIFDVAMAGTLLVAAAPALLGIAVLVRSTGGPVFYSHRRVGFAGVEFGCLKFRTMVPDADRRLLQHLAMNPEAAAEWATRRKLAQDPRVTRIGAWLRRTSLDEVPQLLNVLRGEMSLVGPRPVMADELSRHYGREGTAAYLAVRPGLTGPWQVSGRSDTSYAERVMLDTAYARSVSFWRDIGILLRTIPAVLSRRGAC